LLIAHPLIILVATPFVFLRSVVKRDPVLVVLTLFDVDMIPFCGICGMTSEGPLFLSFLIDMLRLYRSWIGRIGAGSGFFLCSFLPFLFLFQHTKCRVKERLQTEVLAVPHLICA
jgi:hypothetical protein